MYPSAVPPLCSVPSMPMFPRRFPALAAIATLACIAIGVVVGCGGGSPSAKDYYGYYHVAGWIDTHAGEATANLQRCTTCHEMNVLRAGSGVPSCMTAECHHKSTPNYAAATIHGARAKSAQDASGGSFASCQICHGQDFKGGASAVSCLPCHQSDAPHPKDWRSKTALDPDPTKRFLHSSKTHVSNGPVCFQCHFWAPGTGNPNNNDQLSHPVVSMQKATSQPSGSPGCYANTMCHDNQVAGHPVPFSANLLSNKGNMHYDAKDAATTQAVTLAQFNADCVTCHAETSASTSPTPGATACTLCHTKGSPVQTGKDRGTCLSCHAITRATLIVNGPTGTGAVFPDIPGHHRNHTGPSSDIKATCNDCHLNVGWGTQAHYDAANAVISPPKAPAPVAFSTNVTPKQVPTFSGGYCYLSCHSKVHGNKSTPNTDVDSPW